MVLKKEKNLKRKGKHERKKEREKRTGWKKRFNDTYYIAHSFISQPFFKGHV